jgi:two-component system response regulator FixJ
MFSEIRAPAPGIVVAVIDDDEAARESFGALLEAAGYAPSLFRSCESFLAEASTDPRCLVLDARFEGMSGLELLGALRQQRREKPTVFVMGWFDLTVRTRAIRFPGVVQVLDKPIAAGALFAAVRAAVSAQPF